MSGSSIDILRGLNALERIVPEWDHLFARDPRATPFQSAAWLVPWWRHYGPGELLAITLRQGGMLTALLPLYLSRDPDDGVLRLVGCGNSDYLDILVDAALVASDAAAAVLGALDTVGEWHRCDLLPLRPDSPLLGASLPPRWISDVALEAEPCPILCLDRDSEGRVAAIPRRIVRNLRNDQGRLDRLGPNRTIAAEEGTLDEIFGALVRLHEARWTPRGEPGVVATSRDRAFHREAAHGLLGRGMLRLFGICLDDKLVGAYHGFVHAGHAYAYLGGFDPELSRIGLGTLLLGHVVASAERDEVRELHFLRGREAYKYAWGATDRPIWRRTLSRP